MTAAVEVHDTGSQAPAVVPAHLQTLSFDDKGQPTITTWDEVFASARRIQDFFHAIAHRFVERDIVAKILKYAFLLREHVLLWGPPGTAKTAVADLVATKIADAKHWQCDLSKYTSEAAVFGDFDVKRAHDTGQLVHLTDGSILQAHFANVGEFLDANTALLRALLRVLNEREFKRGPQYIAVPLMTAIANTNIDPTTARGKSEELNAVLDRFLFWRHVCEVQDAGNRYRMLQMFLAGKYDEALPPLHIRDVQLVSGVVLRTNLLTNEFILHAYEELTREFAKARNRPITDRRLNKGAQIMEASAILDGQTQVDWNDLDRTGLVFVEREDEEEKFAQALRQAKEKWRNEETQTGVSQEHLALDGLLAKLPSIRLGDATAEELIALRRDTIKLRREVESFRTSSPGAAAKRASVMDTIGTRLADIQKRIDGE